MVLSKLLDPAWRDWYHDKHEHLFHLKKGTEFEEHISSLLRKRYPDFFNPDTAGSMGDGGCDGLANEGRLFFACYGQNAETDIEGKARRKFESDFNRAVSSWDCFEEWTFVTNSPCGPTVAESLVKLQREHSPDSQRPLKIKIWNKSEILWDEIVSRLDLDDLNQLFPGVPHAQNVHFEDLIALIEELEEATSDEIAARSIDPVSSEKMEFNKISRSIQYELNEGRIQARRIDAWFAKHRDPEIRDRKAEGFHALYLDARELCNDPSEIMEHIYIGLGGPNFRQNARRANAVYSVVSYFFDTCDIFEPVPECVEGL